MGFHSIIIIITLPTEMKAQKYKWPDANPPVAAINPHIRSIHGDIVVDNYCWMIICLKK